LYNSVWRNLNDRNVAYLWDVSGRRNLNLNWLENDWNAKYRFAAVRNLLYFPSFTEGFLLKTIPRIQPPSIFPVSFNFSENNIYFLLSKRWIIGKTPMVWGGRYWESSIDS